jgi:hypothetical protein
MLPDPRCMADWAFVIEKNMVFMTGKCCDMVPFTEGVTIFDITGHTQFVASKLKITNPYLQVIPYKIIFFTAANALIKGCLQIDLRKFKGFE